MSVDVRLLLPGQRCELCQTVLLLAAVRTPLGNVFCTNHGDLPHCRLCSAPHRGTGKYCGPCSGTAIDSQAQVRVAAPKVRAELHAMGVVLDPPVRVSLVDETSMRDVSGNESGRVVGTTTVGGQTATEISVLAGLPEVEFGAALAHEAMHAWLAQNGFPRLDPRIEEGLCQVVAYRYLRDLTDPRAKVARQRIDRMPDPVYGDGFREVKRSVRRLGMNEVLTTVRATGRLP